MSRTRHAPVPPVIAVPANFVALGGITGPCVTADAFTTR